jgi:hypothetical protein
MSSLTYSACEIDFSQRYNSNALFLSDKLGQVQLWLKEYPLPGMSLNVEELGHEYHSVQSPGNVYTYDEFTIDVFLDEVFQNHKVLYDWMLEWKFGAKEDAEGLAKDDVKNIKDNGTLLFFKPTTQEIILKVTLFDMFCTSIGGITVTNIKDGEALSLNAGFRYNRWEAEYLS